MIARLSALLLLTWLGASAQAAGTDLLVTHLDVDHVDVTARYQGENILLFGAVPKGTEVVIKMVSPVQEVELTRKHRIGPLWLDGGHLTVTGTPELVYLISSRPLDQLLNATQRQTLDLTLNSALGNALLVGEASFKADWQSAFLRLKQRNHRYVEDGQAVRIDRGRLFYAHVDLPAESPLGRYRLSIYLVRDGQVVRAQEQYLEVQEVSLEGWVSRVVHDHPWWYGILFTFGVMVLGLGLGVVLKPARAA